MTNVKICGLKRVEDALVATDAGAAMLGFVFAPSRRRLEPEQAAEIIAAVRRGAKIVMVGVFVNESAAVMNRIAELIDLDYLQLSGDESEDLLPALNRPVIKTLHIGPDNEPESISQRASVFSAQMLHLDTARTGSYGGTGAPFDWGSVPTLDRPMLLAGGLQAANVQQAIRQIGPWGVDVSSGVETDGVKDPCKIREFIRQAHGLINEHLAPA